MKTEAELTTDVDPPPKTDPVDVNPPNTADGADVVLRTLPSKPVPNKFVLGGVDLGAVDTS